MIPSEPNPCQVDGCNRPQKTAGLCGAHYKRLWKYGDPLATGQHRPRGLTRDELFLRKVDMTSDPDGCWRWKGKIQKRGRGYGEFAYRDPESHKVVSVPAHRYAYEMWVGPIPEGLTIDHVWDNGCRYTDCVRAPAHLEPVTHAEQNRRHYSRQTHCKNGHPLSGENMVIVAGKRICRTCRKVTKQAFDARQKEGRRANPAALQTHCKHGHEFTEENTLLGGPNGRTRYCRACRRRRGRELYLRNHPESTSS